MDGTRGGGMATEGGLLSEVMVARQPVIDRGLDVVGYELLFNDAADRPAAGPGDDLRAVATLLIDGLLALGREIVTDGDDAYLDVPTVLLHAGALLDLPSDGLVLQVLEDALPSPATAQVLAAHRSAGYRMVFSVAAASDPWLELLDPADRVKVDRAALGDAAALTLVRELASRGVPVVVSHVQEPDSFERFVAAGASLVQGFFFTRPRAVRARRPLGMPAAHLQLLRELAQSEVDLARVEELIRSDLTLTDRFLRMVDVISGWREVESVRHGLVLMGTRRLHRWVSLLLLSSVESTVPGELLMTASARARYCEELQQRRGRVSGLEPFTLGMFSVLGLEGIVDELVLADVPVSDAVRRALLGHPGELRGLIEVAIAAERGDWSRLVELGRGLGLQPRELAQAHHQALRWSVQAKRAAGPAT